MSPCRASHTQVHEATFPPHAQSCVCTRVHFSTQPARHSHQILKGVCGLIKGRLLDDGAQAGP